MKHIKKIISGAFIGVGIGFTLNLLFSFLKGEYYAGVPSFLEQYNSTLLAVTVQTLIYMSLGIIQAFSTDVMNNQKNPFYQIQLIIFL